MRPVTAINSMDISRISISIAAEATGNSMMKDRYNQMAREELPEEEYQKVRHLLEIRTHTTE